MTVRNRYDKNEQLLPADYQLTELPKDLYELLSEVYTQRLQKLEEQDISTSENSI